LGIGYAYLMYQRGRANPDWYMRTGGISPLLTKQFWIDDAFQRLIVEPTLAISGVFRQADVAVVDGIVRAFGKVGMVISALLARFDRSVIDGAVDGLGDGVIEGGRETRKIETGNVQTYLLLLAASIVVLLLVFAR